MSPASTATASARRTVALVGRANAGKTSLLMHLTGSLQRPVNFPGSSVERVESEVRVHDLVLRVVDLPGVASLVAGSRDEDVALRYLQGEDGPPPDLLCVVLDAAKLPVELRFLQSLQKLGRPIVVALGKVDVASAEGAPVDAERLQQALGVPLVVVHGGTGAGTAALREYWRRLRSPCRPRTSSPPRPRRPCPRTPAAAPAPTGSTPCCCTRCSARWCCWRSCSACSSSCSPSPTR